LVKGLVPKKLLHIQRITKIEYFLIIAFYIVFFLQYRVIYIKIIMLHERLLNIKQHLKIPM